MQERWTPGCHPTHTAGRPCKHREMSTLLRTLLSLSVNPGWFITTTFLESTHEVKFISAHKISGSSLQHKPHCCQSTPVTSWCSPDHSTSWVAPNQDILPECSSLFLPHTWLLGFIKHTSEKPLSPPRNHSDKTWHCADPAQIVAPLQRVGTRAVTSAEGLLLIPVAAGDHWEQDGSCW